MDISKGNFAASCADICALIEKASFVAIDLEMSGITSPTFSESCLNTPEKSYLATRDAAQRYSIIQVGLCLFEELPASSSSPSLSSSTSCSSMQDSVSSIDQQQQQQQPQQYHASFLKKKSSPSGGASHIGSPLASSNAIQNNSDNTLRLIARPFNFFVFPSGSPGGSSDPSAVFVPRDVVVSPDAASFLRNHNMDWSRWIDQGVSYCNRIEMIKARDKIWKRHDDDKASAPRIARETRALLSEAQQAWLDAALVSAATFVASSENRAGAEYNLPPIRNTSTCVALKAAVNNDPSLAGKVNVSFRGKRGSNDCVLVRRAFSLEEEAQRSLIEAVGFTNIFHTLLNQRKPIIGHNSFADWCFMMESFYEPLPPTLDQFKDQMRVAAPAIYDTKILANGGCFGAGPDEPSLIAPGTFEQTHLEGLFKAFGGLGGCLASNSSSSSLSGQSSGTGGGSNASLSSPTSPRGQLEITLPLGFQNYSAVSSKGASAHEAGFDALMTGVVFGHFLANYSHTPLVDSAENKIALFRSMYALDMAGFSSNQAPASCPIADVAGLTKKTKMMTTTRRTGGGFGSGVGDGMITDDVKTENSDPSSSSSTSFSDVFLPGRHEVLHIKHSLGTNIVALENALRACCENVSFFFGNTGSGDASECVACFGRAGVNNNNDNNNEEVGSKSDAPPQADAKKVSGVAEGKSTTLLLQRPKAVSIAQLNERIDRLSSSSSSSSSSSPQQQQQQQQQKYTDEAALAVLKATTRTHILAPHMQWQATPPPSFAGLGINNNFGKGTNSINRIYTPPPPKFKIDEFKDRDVKTLFRKVATRRR